MDRFRGWWILQILVCSTSCITYPPWGHSDIEANVWRARRLPSSHHCQPAWRQASAIFFIFYFFLGRLAKHAFVRLSPLILSIGLCHSLAPGVPHSFLHTIFPLSRPFISPPPSSSCDVEIVFPTRLEGRGAKRHAEH